MTFRQFEVADEDTIGERLGIYPGHTDDIGVGVLHLTSPDSRDEFIELTYDTPGRSVTYRWVRDGEVLVTCSRECATRLTAFDDHGTAGIEVTFETDSLEGTMTVMVRPRLQIRDDMLMC